MKKDWKKKLLAGLLVATTVLSLGGVTTASAESYTYTIKDEVVPAPDAYTWEKSVRAQDLGIEDMSSLTDTFCKNGKIYILMNGKLVITDENFNTQLVITEYLRDGAKTPIKAPKCVFVTDNGDIYLTEQDQGEIIHLDAKGNLVGIYHYQLHYHGTGMKAKTEIEQVISQIVTKAKGKGKSIVIEQLDFKKTKAQQTKGKTKKGKEYNRMLHKFDYSRYQTVLENGSHRKKVELIKVNPKNTSKIGKQKYRDRMKLSVHQAASYVIARRGQGYQDRFVS